MNEYCWVEIMGLPGVGKTDIISKSVENLRSKYHIFKSDKSNIHKYFFHLFFYSKYKRKINDENLTWKISYRKSLHIFHNRRRPTLFFDSGLAQIFLENLIESNFSSRDQKLRCAATLIRSDTVVVIRDDLARILTREMTREKRRFNIDYWELKKRYEEAEKIMFEQIIPLFDNVVVVDLEKGEDLRSLIP